ncbi:6280_t:CDS:2 [Paraglomus brasilianum]|uniref:6280_t:CDS:1 n=1 Tax=Paraglomus brasilianum TaxID=144538 RepID=A0A9N9AN96_9GLOM|nr:6280_t:CDS:2 [Paraglomus brasilianum]
MPCIAISTIANRQFRSILQHNHFKPLCRLKNVNQRQTFFDHKKATFTSWSVQEAAIQFSWTKLGLIAVGVPLAVYAYKCTMLVLFQNKLIYVPYLPPGSRQMQLDNTRVDKRMLCKKVHVWTPDGCKLAGIIARAKKSNEIQAELSGTSSWRDIDENDPVMIYFQGNAGTMLTRLPAFEHLLLHSTKAIPNLTIAGIGYRGYWSSTGRPFEKGLQRDALAIFDFVRQQFPRNPLYLYGHSLGGAVMLYLASHPHVQKEVRGIILENTFTSLQDMAAALYPQSWLPYKYLARSPYILRSRWESEKRIKDVTTPILFLSSVDDELIPQSQMMRLRGNATNAKFTTWVDFRNALHMNTYMQDGYLEAIKQFIDKTL